MVFALPYERDFTLIGTTDENFQGDPAGVAPSGAEIAYLCETASRYFRQPVTPDDIVQAFAGVRSLYDDGSKKPEEVTRDYHLAFDKSFGHAPLLTVYGGKITTYRKLAEAAMKKLADVFAPSRPWTARVPLPGGNFPYNGVDAQVAQALPHLAVPAGAACAASGARLWHADRGYSRPGRKLRRSRHALRRRSDRGRGPLSDDQGMGGRRR